MSGSPGHSLMKIEYTYPQLPKQKRIFLRIRNVMKYLLLIAALACLIVNYFVKGKAWSIVAVWSMWMFWNLILSPDVIELNLISQTVKILFYVCILLWLIDFFLASGWAIFVVPIVAFTGLIMTALFFLIDVNSQIQNSMPMIWLILISLAAVALCYFQLPEINWPIVVLGGVALAMLFAGVFFHEAFMLELKKRFHTN